MNLFFRIAFLFIFICIPFQLSAQQRTFYIDYNAVNDNGSGQSKSSAFKRHPYMNGFSGSYSHQNGDRFIFKGGVVWPAVSLPLVVAAGGIAGNPDYYGVDSSWCDSNTWHKPIFDGQVIAKSILVIGTAGSHVIIDNFELRNLLLNTTDNFGNGIIKLYRASDVLIKNCLIHNWDFERFSNTFIYRKNGYAYIQTNIPHGFEINQPISVGEISDNTFNGADTTTDYGNTAGVDSILRNNCFRYKNSGSNTDTIFNSGWSSAFYRNEAFGAVIGNYDPMFTDVMVENSEIHNENGPMCGSAFRMIYTVRNNSVHDVATFVLYGNTISGNTVYNICYPKKVIDPDSHTNLLYFSWNGENTPMPDGSSGSVCNNLIYDVNTAEGIFILPGYGGGTGTHTMYIYGNTVISRGIHNMSIKNAGAPLTGLKTNVYIIKNTLVQHGTNEACIRTSYGSSNGKISNLTIQNNHCIVNRSEFENNGGYDTLIYNGQIIQTKAKASSEGYTETNLYAPKDSTRITVNAGTPIDANLIKMLTNASFSSVSQLDVGAYEFSVNSNQKPRLLRIITR